MNINATKEAIETCLKHYANAFTQVEHYVSTDDTKVCSYYIHYGTSEKMVRYIELTVQEYGKKQKVIWVCTNAIGISMNELRNVIKAVETVGLAK